MNIRFNVTGADRKRLVVAAGEALGAVPVYMKAPSFAYTVGGFVIDKEGTLSCDGAADGAVLRDLVDRLAGQGFVSEDSSVAMEDSDAEASAENARAANTPAHEAPAGDMPDERDPVGEVPDTGAPDRLVIEMPLDTGSPGGGFTGGALYNLERMVESKAALIRKAIGACELPIVRENDRLCFPWFSPDASPEETAAYTQFVAALCDMAKKQKRVTAKEKPADSEKFAFRCFLLRLGFIGAEYAAARKILLRNLSGSGSFKNGDSKRRERDDGAPQAANAADSGAEIVTAASIGTGETAADSAATGGAAAVSPPRCGECQHHCYYTEGLLRTGAGDIIDTSKRAPDKYTHYCLGAPSRFRKIKNAADWSGCETSPKWCPLHSVSNDAAESGEAARYA